MSYRVLGWGLLLLLPLRGQNTSCVFKQQEAGVTPEARRDRAAILRRDGVAPAHSGVLPASKSIVASCATSMLPTTSRHPQGDAKGDGTGDVCLSRIRHSVET